MEGEGIKPGLLEGEVIEADISAKYVASTKSDVSIEGELEVEVYGSGGCTRVKSSKGIGRVVGSVVMIYLGRSSK